MHGKTPERCDLFSGGFQLYVGVKWAKFVGGFQLYVGVKWAKFVGGFQLYVGVKWAKCVSFKEPSLKKKKKKEKKKNKNFFGSEAQEKTA